MTEAPSGSIVTVSQTAGPEIVARAQAIAARCGLEFRRRPDRRAPAMVVLERQAAHMVVGGRTVKSHPGLGLVRLRRLRRGDEDDPLPIACDLHEGDTVLDATFGYGTDSLVLAWAVGASGRVVARESSGVLAALALAGLHSWPRPAPEVTGRIALEPGDFGAFLAQSPPGSVDVVYFDPMFRDPRMAAPDFEVLRKLADPRPLTSEALALARRTARRRVVIKDASTGTELRRLGVERVTGRRRAEVIYGVVDALGA